MLLQSLCEFWMTCEVLECSVFGELAPKNNCVLSNSKAAIKAYNGFQINSKLAWNCHQSRVKLLDITRFNWYGCLDTWELTEINWLIN